MVSPSNVLVVIDAGAYYLFKDLCEVPMINKYIISTPTSPFLSIAYKLHTNKKIGEYVWLPYRDVWFHYEDIERLLPSDGYLLVNSMAMSLPTLSFWRKLKYSHPKVKFVLILVDSMHGQSKHMREVKKRIQFFPWDIILSYDQNDCVEYGYRYIGFSYYSHYDNICPSASSSDLYYISSLKGRENILREISKACDINRVNNLFKIYSIWKNIDYGETLRKPLPYTTVLADILSTNCILEILPEGQRAQTLRYLEAICYKKKLLSNNPDIKNLPLYDERYMHFFDRIEDVDWEWVKRKESVNYKNTLDISSADLLNYLF